MPGKIFINETADKQKVELTTGADGVTGGYYDAAGEWHDFGGGSSNARTFFINTITNSAESNHPIDITQCLTTSQYGIIPVYFTEMENSISAGSSSSQPIVSLVGDISLNEYTGIVSAEGLRLEVSGPAELYEVGGGYYFIKPTADGEIVIVTEINS